MKVEGMSGDRGVARFVPAPHGMPQCPYECLHGSRCYRLAHHPDSCETDCSEFGITRFNGPRIWSSLRRNPAIHPDQPRTDPPNAQYYIV